MKKQIKELRKGDRFHHPRQEDLPGVVCTVEDTDYDDIQISRSDMRAPYIEHWRKHGQYAQACPEKWVDLVENLVEN